MDGRMNEILNKTHGKGWMNIFKCWKINIRGHPTPKNRII